MISVEIERTDQGAGWVSYWSTIKGYKYPEKAR